MIFQYSICTTSYKRPLETLKWAFIAQRSVIPWPRLFKFMSELMLFLYSRTFFYNSSSYQMKIWKLNFFVGFNKMLMSAIKLCYLNWVDSRKIVHVWANLKIRYRQTSKSLVQTRSEFLRQIYFWIIELILFRGVISSEARYH